MEAYFNAHLVDSQMDFMGSLLVDQGKICGLLSSEEKIPENFDKFDMEGKILMPSFVDCHAHFRDPGYPEKETIETGSMAALRGGYTACNLMANTKPICDNPEVYSYIIKKSRDLDLIDISQVMAITKGLDGKTLSHWEDFPNSLRFLSDDGKGVESSDVMEEVMTRAKEKNLGLMLHEEVPGLSRRDYRAAEDLMTIRDSYLAEKTGARVHFSHVSTRDSIESIKGAKERGANVTCEVTPHHIYLYDSDYRVNPPIREKEDVSALIAAIIDGTVDCISTDHAPHTEGEKKEGAPGMIGLETAFPIVYKVLVEKYGMDLKKISLLMSENPAKILGLNKGRLLPGFEADFVLVEIGEEYRIDDFSSKSKNSPFKEDTFRAKILRTYRKGRLSYQRREN